MTAKNRHPTTEDFSCINEDYFTEQDVEYNGDSHSIIIRREQDFSHWRIDWNINHGMKQSGIIYEVESKTVTDWVAL